MLSFRYGDRVAVRGEPDRCGTITKIDGDGMYLISWDDKVVGKRAEENLMPCPGSHTEQRIDDPSMPRDLTATLEALAEIDARVEHVALGANPESDMNILACAIRNLIEIVRDLAAPQS